MIPQHGQSFILLYFRCGASRVADDGGEARREMWVLPAQRLVSREHRRHGPALFPVAYSMQQHARLASSVPFAALSHPPLILTVTVTFPLFAWK